MTTSEIADVVLAVVNAALFIYLLWLTRRYARATDGLLEMTRTASYGSVYIWATDLLSEPKRVEARDTVIKDLPKYKGTLKDMPPDLRKAFDETCRTYDAIGAAGLNGMLPHEIIVREWGDSIIKTYEPCARFLTELREERGPLFWNDFPRLYKKALEVWERPSPSRPSA